MRPSFAISDAVLLFAGCRHQAEVEFRQVDE